MFSTQVNDQQPVAPVEGKTAIASSVLNYVV